MWDDILGHEQNKEFLARLLQPGNRPHALLFYGPEGIGKKQLALRFAKTFLCQKPDEHPCGRCESCRLINLAEHSFAHPDFILVEQEAPGKDLKIEQIKEMSRQAAFAPALSSHKVCVIDAADRMTVEAANSLFKAARRAAAKLDVYSGCVAAGTPVADDPFAGHSITL